MPTPMPELLSTDAAALSDAVAAPGAAEPMSVFGPYAQPTDRASKELARKLRAEGAWWIAFPLNDTESRDFTRFLARKGVGMTPCGDPAHGAYEADRDLCPYVWAWRLLRGEVVLTALGRAQYATKAPFRETVLQ